MTRLRVSVAAAGLAALIGCTKSHPYGEVAGTVTMDGRPIDDGSIRFVPVDGNTSSAGGAIKAGKFSVARVPVARHKVEVSAPKPGTGGLIKKGDGPAVEVIADEWIPDRYSSRSELTCEVKTGTNALDLDLKSK